MPASVHGTRPGQPRRIDPDFRPVIATHTSDVGASRKTHVRRDGWATTTTRPYSLLACRATWSSMPTTVPRPPPRCLNASPASFGASTTTDCVDRTVVCSWNAGCAGADRLGGTPARSELPRPLYGSCSTIGSPPDRPRTRAGLSPTNPRGFRHPVVSRACPWTSPLLHRGVGSQGLESWGPTDGEETGV